METNRIPLLKERSLCSIGHSHMVAFLNERLCSGKTFLLLQFICIRQISIS